MYRTHTCGALNSAHLSEQVTLSGWVQRIRNKGFMIWIDLRDRYGITQLIFDEERTDKAVFKQAKTLSREDVIQIQGTVIRREAVNANIPTGEIEILVTALTLLNHSEVPPFTIEDNTDGGEDLRMKYRYLDIRRTPVRENLIFRHKVGMMVRNYLSAQGFIEVETPVLIKSTPEGARDFVVPSRMNAGEFYALPQSPQTFKQLLMVGGLDKYFQIVKCFRDEDLRADRQPEFTQIDCEMSFVEQEDIIQTFEGLAKHLLKELKGLEFGAFPRMTYAEAMKTYGNDKPDIRFGMKFGELNDLAQHRDFKVFNEAELVVGIAVPGANSYTRKEIDALVEWVKRPQIGASGLVYVKCNEDGSFKSSVDKFYSEDDLKTWAERTLVTLSVSSQARPTKYAGNSVPSVWNWPSVWACAIPMYMPRYGSWIFLCLSGTKRKTASLRCTTPSPRLSLRIFLCSTPTQELYEPMLTTLYSMATK